MSEPGRRNRRWIGAALIVVGLVAALLMVGYAVTRRDANVDALAPAPPGCRSTLEFDETGTYYLFVEERGSLDPLPGGCPAGGSYESTGSPDPQLSLTAADGTDVSLRPVDGPSYDEDAGRGHAIRSFEVERPGEYTLDVYGSSTDFLVRVGADPNTGTAPWFAAAAATAAVGLLAGLLLMLRRASPPPSIPAPVAVSGPPAESVWPMPQQRPVGPRLVEPGGGRPLPPPGAGPDGWRPLPQPPNRPGR